MFCIIGIVRPVCLPTPSFPTMRSGESVYVVGFGRTLQAKTSPVKQKLRLPIYDHTKCKQKFSTKNVDVTDGQICAGGEFSRDACDGGKLKLIQLHCIVTQIEYSDRFRRSTHAIQGQLDCRGNRFLWIPLRSPGLARHLHKSVIIHRVD